MDGARCPSVRDGRRGGPGIGSIVTIGGAAQSLLHGDAALADRRARERLGRTVLLGLEFLIIADIVSTITIDTTVDRRRRLEMTS